MTSSTTAATRAARFRRLHERGGDGILVLPNAWDAMSARVIEAAGARAIATTSAGVSWSLGRPDRQGLTRDEMIDAVQRIAATVRIPVTADVEGGYGRGTSDDVAETVRRAIGAGAVGINLEDTPGVAGRALLEEAAQAERIAAARRAALPEGVDLFINARIDVYLLQVGDEAGRFDETVRRAHAYKAAGADGIFVPGVSDAPTIRRLASAIEAPLNVLAGPGSPTTAELRELGVARVSLGPGISQAVIACVRGAAEEVLQRGTYEALRGALPFSKANGLFSRAE
jgi:2-methylisocitrate lyase-like PEP mutase family enzyme